MFQAVSQYAPFPRIDNQWHRLCVVSAKVARSERCSLGCLLVPNVFHLLSQLRYDFLVGRYLNVFLNLAKAQIELQHRLNKSFCQMTFSETKTAVLNSQIYMCLLLPKIVMR